MVWSDCVIVRLTAAGVLILASLSGRHCHVVADCHFVPGSLQALNGSHCEISIAVSIFLFFVLFRFVGFVGPRLYLLTFSIPKVLPIVCGSSWLLSSFCVLTSSSFCVFFSLCRVSFIFSCANGFLLSPLSSAINVCKCTVLTSLGTSHDLPHWPLMCSCICMYCIWSCACNWITLVWSCGRSGLFWCICYGVACSCSRNVVSSSHLLHLYCENWKGSFWLWNWVTLMSISLCFLWFFSLQVQRASQIFLDSRAPAVLPLGEALMIWL